MLGAEWAILKGWALGGGQVVTGPPTLQTILLSTTSFTAGVLSTFGITGATPGSTITLASSDGTPITVTGTSASWTPSVGNPSITPTEVLAGATNSPNVSPAIPVTVASLDTLPSLTTSGILAIGRFDAKSTVDPTSNPKLVLSQGQQSATAPAAYFDFNRVSTLINRQSGVTGALPNLSTIPTGGQATNGPVYEAGALDDYNAMSFDYNDKGIGSAPGSGLVMGSANAFTIALVATIQRPDRFLNSSQPSYGVIASFGPKLTLAVSMAGSAKPGTPGQLGLFTGGPGTGWVPITSGSMAYTNVGVILRVIPAGGTTIGTQAVGTVRAWVNGVQAATDAAYVADPAAPTPSQIMFGCAYNTTQFLVTMFDGFFYEAVIWNMAVVDADVPTLQSWLNAAYKSALSNTYGIVPTGTSGQSNANALVGTPPSSLPLDQPLIYYNATFRQLWGNPCLRDESLFLPKPTSVSNKPLLESNANWSSSTAYETTPVAAIDDINSPATASPSSWVRNTTVNSLGASTYPALADWVNSATLAAIRWYQGENDSEAWYATTGKNWNATVSGNPYTGLTVEQKVAQYQQGLTKHIGLYRAGGSTAFLDIILLAAGGGASYDLTRIAQMQWVAQNPTLGRLVMENPWETGALDLTVPPHLLSEGYTAIAALMARKLAWWLKQAGQTPAGSRRSGPTYGQNPAITGISAVAGNSFIDVTYSNPNGAGTLLLPSNFGITATTTLGSTTVSGISSADMAKLVAGMPLSGPGIKAGVYIASLNAGAGTLVMSGNPAGSAATASGTNVTLLSGWSRRYFEVWLSNQAYGIGFAGTTTTAIGAGTYEKTGNENLGTAFGENVGTPALLSPFDVRIPIGNPLVSGTYGTYFMGRENTNRGTLNAFGDTLADNAGTTAPAEPFVSSFARMNMSARICPEGFRFSVA